MTIFGLRPRALLRFYGWRVRRHPVQELFAAAGIAVGVALVFAVQVANTSITDSASQLVRGITGSATLQLAARSESGFDQRLGLRAANLPGVRHAAPVLRVRGTLRGPHSGETVELIGVTPALSSLRGQLTRNFGARGLRLNGGLALPMELAETLGAETDRRIALIANGGVHRVAVAALLGRDTIGPLAGSRVAIGSLAQVQTLADRPGKLSQLVIEPEPGREAEVEAGLRRIAAGRLNVAAADTELELLRQASEPNDQSTSLFAGISAMVGFLFAVNAMLLTVAERRRFIADLRMQGFSPRQVLTVLGFESLLLGGLASFAGLMLGDLLSRAMFDEIPAYLAFAFPVGTTRVVHPEVVALAFCGGILATFLASLRPLLDLRSGAAVDAVFRQSGEPGEAIGPRATRALLVAGAGLVALTTVLALLVPGATIVGGITLALATLLLMPAAFSAAGAWLTRICAKTRRFNMVSLALMELETTKTRSIALAAVGALAVYGGVAIGGARDDLIRGLDQHTAERLSTADLWVTNGNNDLTTDSFRLSPQRRRAIARAPGIAGVGVYQSSLLDVAGRRVWVIGRPRSDTPIVPPSQVLEGDHALASARLRRGGWATVSDALARSRQLTVGDRFTLPAPAGSISLRVAAITSNLGWGPGAITLNRSDYRRAWGSNDPAALEIQLQPGTAPVAGKRAVERALGTSSPLRVQTLAERSDQYHALARQGLTRLSQISTLLLIAAALAMASAMGAAVWQRRRRLAALKVQGFDRWQLWRGLLHETGFILVVGCGVGASLGVCGHALASRWLELTTGYPTEFAFEGDRVLFVLALVAGTAYAVTAFPGFAAAQTPMRTSFQE